MSESQNRRIIRPWSVVQHTSDQLDDLADVLEVTTGTTIDRSKMLTALAEIAIAAQSHINTATISDVTTLKAELCRAIGEYNYVRLSTEGKVVRLPLKAAK